KLNKKKRSEHLFLSKIQVLYPQVRYGIVPALSKGRTVAALLFHQVPAFRRVLTSVAYAVFVALRSLKQSARTLNHWNRNRQLSSYLVFLFSIAIACLTPLVPKYVVLYRLTNSHGR